MFKFEHMTRVTMVCKTCKGYAVIEGTPYPTGPSSKVYCPFCGVDNTPQRSNFEQALMGEQIILTAADL